MGEWTAKAQRAYDAFSRGVIDTVDFDEDVELSDPGFPQPFRGLAAVREFLEGVHKAFPDGRMAIRNAIESENSLVLETTLVGTHLGPLPIGVPATGKKISQDMCQVLTIDGGKIVRFRNYTDLMSLMTQLGLVAQPEVAR